MIYVTGDTHAEFDGRFNTKAFPEQKQMTKEDFLIICGDFGGVWNPTGENRFEQYWLEWFDKRTFTTLFVDGNHENHERLATYPVKEWNGGKVHEIRPSVLHLMRGQVFTLQGKTIFTFGGAQSHDISAGVFEPDDPDFDLKVQIANNRGYSYRVNHVSWWKEEMPSEEEMQEGLRNLEAHNNKVDFIVTHCCSSSTQALIGGSLYKPDAATTYLEQIKNTVSYKKWFFGHYHDNRNVSDKEILLYEQLVRIM